MLSARMRDAKGKHDTVCVKCSTLSKLHLTMVHGQCIVCMCLCLAIVVSFSSFRAVVLKGRAAPFVSTLSVFSVFVVAAVAVCHLFLSDPPFHLLGPPRPLVLPCPPYG